MPRARVKVRTIDRDRGYKRIRAAIASMRDLAAQVGYFTPENAAKAAFAEFGTETTPARPFMSSALDSGRVRIFTRWSELLGRVVDGDLSEPRALQILADEIKTMIQASIDNGNWAPNKASTIESKGSSKPLVDSGSMRAGVKVEIKAGL